MYDVWLDGVLLPSSPLTTKFDTQVYLLAQGMKGQHNITVQKRTEARIGVVKFGGFVFDGKTIPNILPSSSSSSSSSSSTSGQRRVEFIGDSITCGHGINGIPPCAFSALTEQYSNSYSSLSASAWKASKNVVSWSGRGMVPNYNDSRPTSSTGTLPDLYGNTLGDNKTIAWDFASFVPQAVVINLGTNDYSWPPTPPNGVFVAGYRKFMALVQSKYGNAVEFFVLCGPMARGQVCDNVQTIAKLEQQQGTHVTYVDMQNILQKEDYGCGSHPGVSGHKKMADILIPAVQKVMGWY